MRKGPQRLTAFLLALFVILSMVPVAMAAESADNPAAATEETTITTNESVPADSSNAGIATASEDYGIMTIADTTSNVSLFDQASPNYTISISQLTIKYKPNGSGSSKTAYIKNIGWHFARYDGTSYPDIPLYCIEPNKDFGASSTGNYMDTGVTVSGSGSTNGQSVWYAMPSSYRRAIMLTLLYSDEMWDYSYSVKSTSKDNNPNTPLRLATQFIIYEIVTGIRNANTFVANGNGYVDGDIFYTQGKKTDGFVECYEALEDQIQAVMALPSFVGSSSSNAPTITMNGTSTTVTDTNGVLSNFTFPNGNGASFSKSGNNLTITQTGEISPNTVFSCYRRLPSVDNSTVALYYDIYGSYQTCVSLDYSSSGYLYGYFKLDAPELTGNLALTKTTSDGKNLSGWQFGIYSDSACTSLAAGPYTTNSSGRINVSSLSPGTYYVKELGHTTSSINSQYTCTSTNPQRVSITAGQTASVSFANTLKPGALSLVKTTSDGKNIAGWQFSIYSDAACTSKISGPHTTDSSGKLSVSLSAGTVYVKELGHEDPAIGALYTCATNPQKVTITPGQTASVTFVNTLKPGRLDLAKTTEDGKHLAGWQFSLYADEACTTLISGPHTTDSSGKLSVLNLSASVVFVKEVGHEDAAVAAFYTCSGSNPQSVTIVNGQTATVTFLNKLNLGSIKMVKKTNTGTNLGGWKIGIYSDFQCQSPIEGSPFTTGADGSITVGSIVPGTYYAKEEPVSDPAWECDTEVKTVAVIANQTATVTFRNTLLSGQLIANKVNHEGSELPNAEFLLEWSENGTDWQAVTYSETLKKGGCSSPDLADGTLFSGEDGTVSFLGLYPTLQYRLSETKAPDNYQLLAGFAYEGELSADKNYTMEVTIVNNPIYQLPKTGSKGRIVTIVSLLTCITGLAGTILYMRRRRW